MFEILFLIEWFMITKIAMQKQRAITIPTLIRMLNKPIIAAINQHIPYTNHMVPLARLYFFTSVIESAEIFSPAQKLMGFLDKKAYIENAM